jgi:hypothetical protein
MYTTLTLTTSFNGVMGRKVTIKYHGNSRNLRINVADNDRTLKLQINGTKLLIVPKNVVSVVEWVG